MNDLNDTIKKVEKLAAELENNPNFFVPALKITETDTIKAKFAELPIDSLCHKFLVEVLEPIHLVPTVHKITIALPLVVGKASTDVLKEVLLKNWHSNFEGEVTTEIPAWMLEVDKVELIECDLLVPKKP